MAEENKPAQTPEELAKLNEETARKVAEQGRDLSRPATPEDFRGVSEGLDALAEQITKKNDPEEKERLEKEAADKAAAEALEKAKADPEAAKAAEEAAKAEAERKAAEDRANEYFKDSPKLPPNASPKSADAFREIKIRAAQDLSAKEAEIEKLKKEIAERDEKLKNPVPPEVEKEIKDLREWRAKLDIDTDPKFKEFDQTAESTREFIYDQLRKSPNVNADKIIEKVKALGGPEMVDWTKIFEGLKDPTLQRIIESSIAEIEKTKFLKAEAIKTTKKNVEQYIADRQSQSTKAATEREESTKTHLQGLLGKFEYMKEKSIDQKADEATKKSVEAHNKFVASVNESVAQALKDDSAEMRALTIMGTVQLMYLQPLYDGVVAKLTETEKKLAEATASLAKFKNVSVNRIRETGAPSDGKLPQPKNEEGKLFTTPATQALDDLARGIMEKRSAAGV